MMNKTIKSIIKGTGLFLPLLLLLVTKVDVSAQNADKLRINEIMVTNETNYIDDFGRRSGWIEIFNPSYGPVNIAGCYLTDDMNDPKKYYIQKGDVLTKIQPRQHIVFFADNDPTLGTFHTNFTLKKRFVALFNANGKTLIDSMTIPAALPANTTYGLIADGGKERGILEKTTPSTNNIIVGSNYASDRFREKDPIGTGMSMTAMSVVFLALILLFIVFDRIGNYYSGLGKKDAAKDAEPQNAPKTAGKESEEVYAAIAMALYEYDNDIHDIENTVLTITRVERRYSPWSSKIYGFRSLPSIQGRTIVDKK
ncbi:MAG: lamin tail domain-containing protein [Prevotellaceae bacterium]|jgi:Na+-transporting methylmalonyl-CoA/oxaloacetate decarboxylase gamma subunit|nr:lamin tail domain-containing protein [Prevotellaceae bacterium]